MYLKSKFFSVLPLILLLISHICLSFSLIFTAWPEMLTYPWLMNNGYHFYGDIIHPYLPLLPYILLSVYRLFGFTPLVLRIFTLIFTLSIDILIYRIIQKKYNKQAVLITLSFFVLFQLFFQGNGLWFDLAGLPFTLLSLLFLSQKKTAFLKWVGICLGLGLLIKQTNLIFLLPSLYEYKNIQSRIKLTLYTFLPLAIISIIFIFIGKGKDLWQWGVWYPIFVLPRMPGFSLLPTVRQIGVTLFIFSPTLLLIKYRPKYWLWFLASFIFAFPRFAFFHLQPAIALFCLLLPGFMSLFKQKWLGIGLTIYIVGSLGLWGKFVVKNWSENVRFFEPEVLKTREILVTTLPINQEIYFYNVPSQYFVGTSLLPMKPWVDTFPWYLEQPGVQEKLIQNLEKIDSIVEDPFQKGKSYDLGAYKPLLIDAYIQNHFKEVSSVGGHFRLLKRIK